MSTKEVTAIAIKLLALSLLVSVVLHAPRLILTISSMERMHGEEFQQNFYISVVSFFLVLGAVCSFALYKTSNSILKSIPESTPESDPIYISEKFILQVAGVYFIVSALQAFPSLAISFSSSPANMASYIGYFIGHAFEVAVGLYLLVAPAVWVRAFNKLRGRA